MKKKTIYLLIGPKGSGKSYIGAMIDRCFQIQFIRVEDWAKTIKRGREIDDEAYLKDVFQVIETGIRKAMVNHEKIVFESTGLTPYFDKMYDSLCNDFNVKSIRISAEDEICLSRVRTRDRSIHIDVSDEQVRQLNKKVKEKGFTADFEITNTDKTDKELIKELKEILN